MALLKGIFYAYYLINISSAQTANPNVAVSYSKINFAELNDIGYDTGSNVSTAISANEKELQMAELHSFKLNMKVLKTKIRALHYIQKNYQDNEHIEWKFKEQYILATINKQDISTSMIFTKKGNWLRSIRTYHDYNLPKDIMNIIEHKFPFATIKKIQDSKERDEALIAYYITVEDLVSYKNVLIYAGRADVYNEVKKR